MSKDEEMVLWALLAIGVYWYMSQPLPPVSASGDDKEIPLGDLSYQDTGDLLNLIISQQGSSVSQGY